MSERSDKVTLPPPYVGYSAFINFLKSLNEKGGPPSRIDKSVLGSMSGSAQSAMISSLKSMGLIDAGQIPQPLLQTLVEDVKDDAALSKAIKAMLQQTYAFVFESNTNLAKATTKQVEELFRQRGLNGSTLVKAISFFLLAAKAAKLEVGPHLKAPSAPKSDVAGKKASRKKLDAHVEQREEKEELPKPGMIDIPVPLHGTPNGTIRLPECDDEQWDYAVRMAKFILDNYRRKKG